MKMEQPVFSIIIPVYNVEKYFPVCLDSVKAQSFADWEALCIDDGSEDRSLEILRGYAALDKRFKVFTQENRGLATSRNVGIDHACGRYLCFLDSDDYLRYDALQVLYGTMEGEKPDIASFETELLYEGDLRQRGNKDNWYYKTHRYPGVWRGMDLFPAMMGNQEYCDAAWLLCIRRDWLSETGIRFYDGILYEDALFSIQCFLAAGRMVHLSERLYTYRIRERSITRDAPSWENVRSRLVVYREILKLMFREEYGELEVQGALAAYMPHILHFLRYLDESRTDQQPEEPLPPLDEFLAESIGIGRYRREANERVILSGIEKMVSDSKGVVLYGAGNVGHLLAQFLIGKGLREKIRCFVVSDPPEEGVSILGIPVCPLSEIRDQDMLTFVSVIDPGARKEILETLERSGMRRVEMCDDFMYRALRQYAYRSTMA